MYVHDCRSKYRQSSSTRGSVSPNYDRGRSFKRSRSRDRSRDRSRRSPAYTRSSGQTRTPSPSYSSNLRHSSSASSRMTNIKYANSLAAELSKHKKAREKLNEIEREKRKQKEKKQLEIQEKEQVRSLSRKHSRSRERSRSRDGADSKARGVMYSDTHRIPLPPASDSEDKSHTVIKKEHASSSTAVYPCTMPSDNISSQQQRQCVEGTSGSIVVSKDSKLHHGTPTKNSKPSLQSTSMNSKTATPNGRQPSATKETPGIKDFKENIVVTVKVDRRDKDLSQERRVLAEPHVERSADSRVSSQKKKDSYEYSRSPRQR